MSLRKRITDEFKSKGSEDPLWVWFGISLITIIVFTIVAVYSNNFYITIGSILVMFGALMHHAAGNRMLGPSQKGVYLKDGNPETDWDGSVKTTQGGGMTFAEPITKTFLIYETGMFTLDIKYKDLTFQSKDDADGIIQVNVRIKRAFIPILIGVTKGTLQRSAIIKEVTHKLEQTAPSKLSIAVENLGYITSGYLFEKETKNKEKKLAKELLNLLTEHGDCYGLELLSVEIPTPHIVGEVYAIDKKIAASVASVDLSKATHSEWNAYLEATIEAWREHTKFGKNKKIPEDVYNRIEQRAYNLYNLEKGNAPNIYDGLGGNTKTIVNASPKPKNNN